MVLRSSPIILADEEYSDMLTSTSATVSHPPLQDFPAGTCARPSAQSPVERQGGCGWSQCSPCAQQHSGDHPQMPCPTAPPAAQDPTQTPAAGEPGRSESAPAVLLVAAAAALSTWQGACAGRVSLQHVPVAPPGSTECPGHCCEWRAMLQESRCECCRCLLVRRAQP